MPACLEEYCREIFMLKILIFFFLFTIFPSADAARPFVTDDARLTTAGSCQVESWARMYRSSQELWILPACTFSGNLEVTAGSGVVMFDDATTPGSSDYILQAKTLFRPLTTNDMGIGLAVGTVRHPSIHIGPNQLGNTYLYVPASFSFADEKLIVHLNAGILRDRASGSNRGTWGTGAEMNATSRLMVIAEMFGDSTGAAYWQSGVRYGIVPQLLQLDTTLGKQMGGNIETQWISFGVRFTPAQIL